VNWLKNNLADI